jgi:hypothetical protein
MALLPAKRKVALSVGPTDPPVAQVLLDRPTTVSVLEEHGGRARILWLATTGRVLGWVASGDLRPASPVGRPPSLAESTRLAILRDVAELGMGGLVGTRRAELAPEAPTPAADQERVACIEPVRILVELGGRRYAVGQIPAGDVFGIRRRDGAVSPLVAPASLDLAEGVAVFVPSREIVGCTATRARKSILREEPTSVTGSLPLEIIQRIVRQNFGRFRICYDKGRRITPDLHGRVTAKFVIDASGAVTSTADGGSDLPDQDVVDCVVRGFGNLSFPPPEAGAVSVTYPIQFDLGD